MYVWRIGQKKRAKIGEKSIDRKGLTLLQDMIIIPTMACTIYAAYLHTYHILIFILLASYLLLSSVALLLEREGGADRFHTTSIKSNPNMDNEVIKEFILVTRVSKIKLLAMCRWEETS